MHDALTVWREYGEKGTVALVEALWSPDVTKRNPEDLKDWYTISTYPNLLETLGVYVSSGLISEELVYNLWGGSIIDAWREWDTAVHRLRIITKTPQVWAYFEYLAKQMRVRLEVEQRGLTPLRTPET
jgi:hypothetical protein